jgi:hypothetical protein
MSKTLMVRRRLRRLEPWAGDSSFETRPVAKFTQAT